ncbi:unnamed protein product [Clonostachys rosea]|uniref:ABM domain-containing protein n=1 Tax=Bionectria ochroleuca TaxID=29856 RepID=A0ABY6TX21_BIOOC|nr:unnamed protein product [Clonostachys rosea]
MVAGFKPKLDLTSSAREYENPSGLFLILLDTLKIQTRILLGALIQVLLCSVLPMRLAITPACLLLFHSIITTVLQVRSPRSSHFQDDVVFGRATSQLPSGDGSYGTQPAKDSIVFFNLGIQYNHPLGVFSQGAYEVSRYYMKMEKNLLARREELGLLSISKWHASERQSNNTLIITFYFKDVESIHKFAQEELHREALDFYHKAKHEHIGVFHETMIVPAKNYENVYVNCRPVLMGTSAVKLDDEKSGGESWATPLVNANHPNLKTQYARLSRHENGAAKE